VISVPGRFLGVHLVNEVRREDGSAWHMLASIINNIDEQVLDQEADVLLAVAEEATKQRLAARVAQERKKAIQTK
jgi:hypothetical protein